MSEAQTRPSAPRGRGSHRAGRGGFSSRGGGSARVTSRHTNGDAVPSTPEVSLDDQGELGQLKKNYASQLTTLRELFPDWTDDDLVLACQETDGDLSNTIERISEGNVSRFADVKKKTKEKPRPKGKDAAVTTETPSASVRGRSRGGADSARGGRGRGSERGRGGGRGGRGAAPAASAAAATTTTGSVLTSDSQAWGDAAPTTSGSWADASTTQAEATTDATAGGQWASVMSSSATPATASEGLKSSLIPEGGAKKSWAMIAQPKVAPAIPKAVAAPKAVETPAHLQSGQNGETIPPDITPSTFDTAAVESEPQEAQITPSTALAQDDRAALLQVTPTKAPLTEDNLEHIPDVSRPAPTGTVASTIDPRSTVGTPYGAGATASQQAPIGRPPIGGFGANAWKNAGTPGRVTSFQKRLLEQQEAVVMPGNHAVDRAAVQFGSMGLNGAEDANASEADDDREEPETRAQPPQQSPSQPRASLPPVSHHPSVPTEPIAVPKPAPGLTQGPNNVPISSQDSMTGPGYGSYGRFGGEQSALQKTQEAFTHQYPGQQDSQSAYPATSQPSSQQHPAQTHLTGLSSSSNDYPTQYGGEHQRNAYQAYYGNSFGQGLGQHETTAAATRTGAGFGGAPTESNYANAQGQPLSSRFGDGQNSGHTTPNPPSTTQQSTGGPQSQQSHMQPPHSQTSHAGAGGYPYTNPYYGNNNYYGGYSNQYPNQYNYNQQGYGGYYGKNNVYGQPHHGYGMSPQTSYEQSSSPANVSGYAASSNLGRDSSFAGTSAMNDYGRSGSTQPSQGGQGQTSGSGYGANVADSLGRSSSGFANQGQQYSQGGLGSSEDSLKPYQDARAGNGPSPSQGPPGRPGSAANNAGNSSSQSSYPQSQSQQGFGGYPNHLNQLHNNHGSQYGSLGGLGGYQGAGQSHQGGSYGSYGGGFGNSYGNHGRGGWGGNYGH